jgi:hypothetical protein
MPKLIETQGKICKQCNLLFTRGRLRTGRIESVDDYQKRKFCSKKCWGKSTLGENHYNWKGGFKTRPDGYIRDSKTDRYLHRIVMEKNLKRKLFSTEHVHHINGNKQDNRLENLEIHSNSSHRKLEVKKQKRGGNGKFID